MSKKLTWNDLFLSGSIVDLDVSRWTARTSTRAADLGIVNSDAVEKAMSLGNLRLIPADAFEGIDEITAKAKKSVEYYSQNFMMIRGARYVPAAKLDAVLAELEGHRTDYNAAVDAFVDAYEAKKSEMLPVLRKALNDAARTPEAAAVALDRLTAEYPSAADVRRKFGMRWNVYALQGSKQAGTSTVIADESEAVRGVVRDMVAQLRAEVTGKLSDVLALIQKGGKLQPRSIEAAVQVLDHVDNVNVLGDAELSAQVKALRRALESIEQGKRVSDSTIMGLEQIKKSLETDIETAVAAAEERLTGVGRRKLEVA